MTCNSTPAASARHAAQPLAGQVALITGASSGIGRAIAVELARKGAAVCAIGRNPDTLGETVHEAAACASDRIVAHQADLVHDSAMQSLEHLVNAEFGRVDILVHSAGVIHSARMRDARLEDLDAQYAANLRMPYILTQRLLPMLRATQGQVVFINSSVGLSAKRADIGQFAATQHALKAVADSLREEVNPDGVRVLTVHPGRTATPRQQALHDAEGKLYRPELLLQAQDVASVVAHVLSLPRTAEVTDINIRPMQKT